MSSNTHRRGLLILRTIIAAALLLTFALPPSVCTAHGVDAAGPFDWSFTKCAATAGKIVRCMAEDFEGRLWLGTDNGLLRHDGMNVVSYTNHFKSVTDRTYCLVPDSNGLIWVGHLHGLTCIDPASLSEMPIPMGLPDLPVRAIYYDEQRDTLWVCSDGGLFRSMRGAAFIQVDMGSVTAAYCIERVSERTILVGTNQSLLTIEDDSAMRVVLPTASAAEQPHHSYRAVHVEPDGTLWVGCRTPGGLYRRSSSGWQRLGVAEGLDDDRVNVIVADHAGSVWVGTEHGVYRWTGSSFDKLTTGTGLECDDVHGLYVTREDQLWIGTYGAGALKLNSQHIKNYGSRQGLRHPFILSLAHVAPDTTYVGTVDGLCVIRPDGKAESLVCRARPIRVIFADECGTVWFGGNKGLMRLVRGEATLIGSNTRLAHANVSSISNGPGGCLWVGTSLGLFTVSPFDYETIPIWAVSPSYFVNQTLVDDSGCTWAATINGLIQFRGEKVLSQHLNGHVVQRIAWSQQDTLLVGTEDKLLKLVDGQLRSIEMPAGAGMISDILPDHHARLWVGTTSGLVRVAERSVLFTMADGLVGEDIRCLCLDNEGHLLAGTTEGLSRIDIENMKANDTPPPIYIERLVSGGKQWERPTSVHLPASPEDVTLKLAALSYRNPDGVLFSYRFSGRDASWSPKRASPTLSFRRLSPGDYLVEVVAYNAHGVRSQVPAVVHLHIATPFWQTKSFVAGIAVVVTLSSFVAWKIATRITDRRRTQAMLRLVSQEHIEAMERERTEIAYELHDELAQMLALVKLDATWIHQNVTGDIAERAADMNAHLSGTLSQTRRLAARLRPPCLLTLGLTGAIEQHLEQLRSRSNLRCKQCLQPIGPDDIDPGVASDAHRIVTEATTNVLRHARATTLEVELFRQDNHLCIAVRDDGVGFVPSRDIGKLTLGLAGMRFRAESHGGSLLIESKPGHGTRVSATLICRRTTE